VNANGSSPRVKHNPSYSEDKNLVERRGLPWILGFHRLMNAINYTMCRGLPLDIGDDGADEVGRLVLLHWAGLMKYEKQNDFTGQAGLCQVE
jgi:hypothetical protein